MEETVSMQNVTRKKNLMNSLEDLNSKIHSLENLEKLSYHLLEKFTDPYIAPKPEIKKQIKKDANENVSFNLIDLFNIVAKKMDKNIDSIRKNLQQISNMVE